VFKIKGFIKMWSICIPLSNCRQLLEGEAPRPPDQGLCPWTPLRAKPPDPQLGSRSSAHHDACLATFLNLVPPLLLMLESLLFILHVLGRQLLMTEHIVNRTLSRQKLYRQIQCYCSKGEMHLRGFQISCVLIMLRCSKSQLGYIC
jgi:hypothetical protein